MLQSARVEPERRQALKLMTPFTAPAGTVRISGKIVEGNLARKAEPVYPPLALAARIQGTVEFSVVIGADGHVEQLRLVRGHPQLVAAAKEAALKNLYKPTFLNRKSVSVVTTVEVQFKLPE